MFVSSLNVSLNGANYKAYNIFILGLVIRDRNSYIHIIKSAHEREDGVMKLDIMEKGEHTERCVDIWSAHKLLIQQRQTIDPYQSTAHGQMYDAVTEAMIILEEYLTPNG